MLGKNISLTGTDLKWIALISMTLDHIGVVLVPRGTLYWILRILGRLAFPIYCFLLTEGDLHTRSHGRYLRNLGIFALLSEIPFDLARSHTWFDGSYQNVYVTLFLGECMLCLFREIQGKLKDRGWLISFFAMILFMILAECLHTDYGQAGIFMIAILAVFRPLNKKKLLKIGGVMALGWIGSWVQMTAALSFPGPIAWYNGKRGERRWKYGFYLYYPLHFMVLILIRTLL
ncbi:MAG: TraX family protein [Clostridiales bacterium]|nr:TraX family protein [Clostridiales bacterium]